jgi:ApbE superfamily uncharacterized protein (UPF0280 family)
MINEQQCMGKAEGATSLALRPSLIGPHSSPITHHSSLVTRNPAAPGRAGGAVRARFADGRWHFQHGPIDLVIGAEGDAAAVADATERAWLRFQTVLSELVAELKWLRLPVQDAMAVSGAVASRMVGATWPHRAKFITPMAAVAGAVADELIECYRADTRIVRAHVNNGGDIALHLAAGTRYRVGLVTDLARVKRREHVDLDGDLEVGAALPVRGIATSGWRGRSFSLGIADSVTVLAATAAGADAAATMIANAVNADHPAIVRRPASELKDDTDLGDRLVTVEVGRLPEEMVAAALACGENAARAMMAGDLVWGAVLCLQGSVRIVRGDVLQ